MKTIMLIIRIIVTIIKSKKIKLNLSFLNVPYVVHLILI